MIARRRTILTLVTGVAMVSILGAGLVIGGEHGRGSDDHRSGWFGARPEVPLASNPTYQSECGSCHFAYQPSLLPARSWKAMMAGLSNHFGDNASLPLETVQTLERYLVANAADSGAGGRGERLARSVATADVPQRITETPYFKRKHHEVPPRMVKDNAEVRSFSHCAACHTRAAEGSFNEHEVRIPGVGRWED